MSRQAHKSCVAVEEESPCFLQKPEFPARMLLGVPFGLAFWGGGEGLLWVRQRGEVTVLCRA